MRILKFAFSEVSVCSSWDFTFDMVVDLDQVKFQHHQGHPNKVKIRARSK